MEATPGFEPGNSGFADRRLTTWLCRLKTLNCFGKTLQKESPAILLASIFYVKCGILSSAISVAIRCNIRCYPLQYPLLSVAIGCYPLQYPLHEISVAYSGCCALPCHNVTPHPIGIRSSVRFATTNPLEVLDSSFRFSAWNSTTLLRRL
jgi:hypothetical protein